MRRTDLIALLLTVVGIEMSTRAFTLVVVRLREGVNDLMGGEAVATVPTERFALGLLILVTGVALGVFHAARTLSVRRLPDGGCPACGQQTKRIRRRAVHRFLGVLMGPGISRRRCTGCGWVGLAKDR